MDNCIGQSEENSGVFNDLIIILLNYKAKFTTNTMNHRKQYQLVR